MKKLKYSLIVVITVFALTLNLSESWEIAILILGLPLLAVVFSLAFLRKKTALLSILVWCFICGLLQQFIRDEIRNDGVNYLLDGETQLVFIFIFCTQTLIGFGIMGLVFLKKKFIEIEKSNEP